MTDFIAIVEVIGSGIVEIYGLLDEPQPECSRVKVKIAQGATGDSRHMMDAGHFFSPALRFDVLIQRCCIDAIEAVLDGVRFFWTFRLFGSCRNYTVTPAASGYNWLRRA
jgi:hypothetical protein